MSLVGTRPPTIDECKMHAHCLMSNHFHFLLETGDIEIGKFMKAFACKYAMQFDIQK